MERSRAILSMCWATLGRCSPILMPGTLVLISLYGPPLAWPGLRSNVSIWLGPPSIHKRMPDRFRCGALAPPLARAFSQPDIEPPSTPAADRVSHSRRESRGESEEREEPVIGDLLSGKP